MQAIEKTKEFIGYLDINPKLSIIEEPYKENAMGAFFLEGYYGLNSNMSFDLILKRNVEILELSVKLVRLRVQRDKNIEIFPFLDVNNTGPFRKAVEVGLCEDDCPLESIDTEIVSVIACNFFQKNTLFLPLIKNIVAMDAKDIVKITEPFLIGA